MWHWACRPGVLLAVSNAPVCQSSRGLISSFKIFAGELRWPSHLLYDTLMTLVQEYDVADRSEIFRLLLERRSPIPPYLPNGDLRLLQMAFKDISDVTVCLAKDVSLMCVALVSCRDKRQSQNRELLRDIFHMESCHSDDLPRGSVTVQQTAVEFGLGCFKETLCGAFQVLQIRTEGVQLPQEALHRSFLGAARRWRV
jgi:hypothetical protein